jgi:hypothetical protein
MRKSSQRFLVALGRRRPHVLLRINPLAVDFERTTNRYALQRRNRRAC